MTIRQYLKCDASDQRYQRLSRLVEQYELGRISHWEFEQAKKEILLEQGPLEHQRPAPIEIFVATYSHTAKLGPSLHELRRLAGTHQADIIDAATVTHSHSGRNRVRSLAGISSSNPVVIIVLCSLLFPIDSIDIEPSSSGWSQWLSYMEQCGIADPILRGLGEALPSGSTSVLVVYKSAVADIAAGAFQGFDSFARRILSDEIIAALQDSIID